MCKIKFKKKKKLQLSLKLHLKMLAIFIKRHLKIAHIPHSFMLTRKPVEIKIDE